MSLCPATSYARDTPHLALLQSSSLHYFRRLCWQKRRWLANPWTSTLDRVGVRRRSLQAIPLKLRLLRLLPVFKRPSTRSICGRNNECSAPQKQPHCGGKRPRSRATPSRRGMIGTHESHTPLLAHMPTNPGGHSPAACCSVWRCRCTTIIIHQRPPSVQHSRGGTAVGRTACTASQRLCLCWLDEPRLYAWLAARLCPHQPIKTNNP